MDHERHLFGDLKYLEGDTMIQAEFFDKPIMAHVRK
jgi:hypothetical protein